MAKKYRSLRRGKSPREVAETVVKRYVEEARKNLKNWSKDYVSNITYYTINADRQQEAMNDLATWYDVLLTVRPKIVEAYAEAKAEYLARKAGVTLPPVKVPA